MPIYRYNCRNCGEQQTHKVAASERDGQIDCVECGLSALDREVAKESPNHNHLRSADPRRLDKLKAKLDAETMMYDLPPEDREQHKEYIKKLEEADAKEQSISVREDAHKHNNGIDITK